MGGLYQGTDLSDKVFYGFRMDNKTGHLNIEILDGDTPVSLPQEGIIDPNDYKQHFFTSDTIELDWGNKGHLLMRFV